MFLTYRLASDTGRNDAKKVSLGTKSDPSLAHPTLQLVAPTHILVAHLSFLKPKVCHMLRISVMS
jgi:hypothetical protein